jgi:general stress protein 26
MDKIVEILKKKQFKLCVLSTISSGASPESAVIGYAVKDDLTLIFSTKKTTRKAINIASNPHVSFVTGWSFTEENVQIEGTARLVNEPSDPEYLEIENFFFSQNREAEKFKSDDTIFIVMIPTWYRLLDHSTTPPTMEEKTIR